MAACPHAGWRRLDEPCVSPFWGASLEYRRCGQVPAFELKPCPVDDPRSEWENASAFSLVDQSRERRLRFEARMAAAGVPISGYPLEADIPAAEEKLGVPGIELDPGGGFGGQSPTIGDVSESQAPSAGPCARSLGFRPPRRRGGAGRTRAAGPR